MNANHILFTTNRFNLSVVKQHFINPCCFGEDLAAWLRQKLTEKGVNVSQPGQEDWGWYLKTRLEETSYFLAMSGNPDQPRTDLGEWRVIVERNRTVWQRLRGRGKIDSRDRMTELIEEILRTQNDCGNVHRESSNKNVPSKDVDKTRLV
jgi:hypothetical protein